MLTGIADKGADEFAALDVGVIDLRRDDEVEGAPSLRVIPSTAGYTSLSRQVAHRIYARALLTRT